jgi:phosphoesterase RecJ-like protein
MEEVLEFLAAYRSLILLGHVEPDADCVASQLALASFLQRQGKEVICLSAGPFERPEVASYSGRFTTRLPDSMDPDAAVILDCSSPSRTGRVGRFIGDLPACVVDHHASGEPFGRVRLVEPAVPATTLLVLRIIEQSGEKPTSEEARLLFLGFCTDTGFFRHLDKDASSAMGDAARLVDYGASPRDTYQAINGGQSLNRFRLLGRLLERTESHLGGRVLLTWLGTEDHDLVDGTSRGSADLYQNLQMVAGSQVIVFIRQEDRENCSVGLRSLGDYDVGKLAKELGGGGHLPAAGFSTPGSVAEVRKDILARLIRDLA